MITPEFLPVHGGVGNYVLQLAKYFSDDVSVHIVTPRNKGVFRNDARETNGPEDELPRNTEVTYLGSAKDTFFKNFLFQLNCSQYVPQIVKKERPDIVHSQSAMPDYLVSPRRLDAPIVTTMHTTVEGHSEALKSASLSSSQLSLSERFVQVLGPALGFLEARYYTNQRYYITVSNWAKKSMVNRQGIEESRIRVIDIGVEDQAFSPSRASEARARFPQLAGIGMPKVLYLSRMATRKGVDVLLRAIPKVLSKTDAHFIFAGAGNKPKFSTPDRNLTYLGHVSSDIPPLLYALSDIFVLPSFYENFPSCILEAMASQCAVVSTPVGGIPEMVDNGTNGMLVPTDDADALADSLIRLVEDKELRTSLGRRARESVVGKYNWHDAARKTAEYYEEVITRHARERNAAGE
jgi:glycosyltransferase involved in cell wall biosynthesis